MQLRQVSRTLLASAGYFRTMYVEHPPARPLRKHLGLPVYGIDVSAIALDVILSMLQTPDVIADHWRHVPLALVGTMKLCEWRGLMRYYGFSGAIEDLDADMTAPKKRLCAATPYDETICAFATALHAHIFDAKRMGIRGALFSSMAPRTGSSAPLWGTHHRGSIDSASRRTRTLGSP